VWDGSSTRPSRAQLGKHSSSLAPKTRGKYLIIKAYQA
jgi:hypothetical protein